MPRGVRGCKSNTNGIKKYNKEAWSWKPKRRRAFISVCKHRLFRGALNGIRTKRFDDKGKRITSADGVIHPEGAGTGRRWFALNPGALYQ